MRLQTHRRPHKMLSSHRLETFRIRYFAHENRRQFKVFDRHEQTKSDDKSGRIRSARRLYHSFLPFHCKFSLFKFHLSSSSFEWFQMIRFRLMSSGSLLMKLNWSALLSATPLLLTKGTITWQCWTFCQLPQLDQTKWKHRTSHFSNAMKLSGVGPLPKKLKKYGLNESEWMNKFEFPSDSSVKNPFSPTHN